MKIRLLKKILFSLGGAALVLAGGGCASTQMKGTPFYSGEYAKRKGPAEQRVNLWPALYYRDPALSALWPVFELTDDHTAVRPLFSVYGLEGSNRQYNVVWPLAQFDERTGRNRVLPVFWGTNYYVVFPLYWHYGEPWGKRGGTDALFPLWILSRSANYFDLYCLWPLVEIWSSEKRHESGSMVLPLYWHERDDAGSRFLSLPWWSGSESNGNYWRLLPPFYYQASNETFSALATPVWAQGRSASKDWQAVIPLCYWDRQQHTLLSPLWAVWQSGDKATALAPWALSWWTRRSERTDLWLAGGLAHANWGEKPGPHHVIPFYYRDAADEELLTLLFGWKNEDRGYFYPLTPLAGVHTGDESGSWFFPVYSYAKEKKTGRVRESFLVLGGYDKNRWNSHSWFFPLFSWREDFLPEKGELRGIYGTKFWCLPYCWYENRSRALSPRSAATNTALAREYYRKHGAFPLWSYMSSSTPAQNKMLVKGSTGVFLYDYKHEVGPISGGGPGATNDYTRARVLWRLWHYERRNGDVSVDVFPTLTYDRKTDGSMKTSFLWRFYRYERAANGTKKLDVLFVPLMR